MLYVHILGTMFDSKCIRLSYSGIEPEKFIEEVLALKGNIRSMYIEEDIFSKDSAYLILDKNADILEIKKEFMRTSGISFVDYKEAIVKEKLNDTGERIVRLTYDLDKAEALPDLLKEEDPIMSSIEREMETLERYYEGITFERLQDKDKNKLTVDVRFPQDIGSKFSVGKTLMQEGYTVKYVDNSFDEEAYNVNLDNIVPDRLPPLK